jgi:hypothetical protein
MASTDEMMQTDDFSGKRRFARGKQLYDMTYYSFDEFLAFCQESGFTKPDGNGNATVEAGAQWLWSMGVDQDKEEAQMTEQITAIHQIPEACWQDFSKGGHSRFLLQMTYPGGLEAVHGKVGFCLQLSDRGTVDVWGQVWLESVMGVEVVSSPHPGHLLARFRAHTGGYLRFTKNSNLDFRGVEGDDNTIFELFQREGNAALVTIGATGGSVLGTFIIRKPPLHLYPALGACTDTAQMSVLLKRVANEAVKRDPSLDGFKRHKQDPLQQFWSFEQFLQYFQKLYEIDLPGALEMTHAAWKYACVGSEEDFLEDQWNLVGENAGDNMEL